MQMPNEFFFWSCSNSQYSLFLLCSHITFHLSARSIQFSSQVCLGAPNETLTRNHLATFIVHLIIEIKRRCVFVVTGNWTNRRHRTKPFGDHIRIMPETRQITNFNWFLCLTPILWKVKTMEFQSRFANTKSNSKFVFLLYLLGSPPIRLYFDLDGEKSKASLEWCRDQQKGRIACRCSNQFFYEWMNVLIHSSIGSRAQSSPCVRSHLKTFDAQCSSFTISRRQQFRWFSFTLLFVIERRNRWIDSTLIFVSMVLVSDFFLSMEN